MIKNNQIAKVLEPSVDADQASKFKAHRFCVAPMLDWTYKLNNYFNKQ